MRTKFIKAFEHFLSLTMKRQIMEDLILYSWGSPQKFRKYIRYEHDKFQRHTCNQYSRHVDLSAISLRHS